MDELSMFHVHVLTPLFDNIHMTTPAFSENLEACPPSLRSPSYATDPSYAIDPKLKPAKSLEKSAIDEQLDKSLYDISIQDEVASMSSTPRSSRRKLCFQIGKSTLHT